MELSQFIKIARGDEPADLLLKGGKIVNVFSGEVFDADVAIAGGRIVGWGRYAARETIDISGKYLAPGFIDAHVHIESSLTPPPEFARAVVPRGTTTVIIDPHEIGNVLGLDGVRYMFDAAKYNPLSIYVMMPSCVPATNMETAGAVLHWYDIAPYQSDPWVLGLAEMMNFPGVVHGAEDALDKLRAFEKSVRDGHAPGLSGPALNAYAAGIGSDHECTTLEEAREKLRLGMVIFIREATNAHNLGTLLPLITPDNARRVCWCTDDRQPADLLDQGHIDYLIRRAIELGLDPVTAIRIGTLNPAEYFRLHDRGAIAPGRRADLAVLDDLRTIRAAMVFRAGRLVARDGELLTYDRPQRPTFVRASMNVDWDKINFKIEARGRKAHVIGAIPDQLITQHLIEEVTIENGEAVQDPGLDLLKIAVIERHTHSGNHAVGFVKGIGLRKGAIASSVAHDHHNIVVIGADDQSMMTAARAVSDMHGGMSAALGTTAAARLHDPFMAMSFLALAVIPELKITDQGLVDVVKFQTVPLFIN